MTIYLLDENVLRQLHARGDENVRKWYDGIVDEDLRIIVMTLFEKRRGWNDADDPIPILPPPD